MAWHTRQQINKIRRVPPSHVSTIMAAATNSDTNPDEIDLELTHEEIWDDSVLVQAWDEALKEYKVTPSPPSNEAVLTRSAHRSTTALLPRERMLRP